MKKSAKRKFRKFGMLVACMVLLVAVSVGITVAYFTDTESVTNTFTVGKVDITLDEAKVDEYGVEATPGTPSGTAVPRVDENEYKLIPGHEYTKDPTIHVSEDSEDCWLFAKIENGLGTNATITMATGWTEIDSTNHIWAYDTVKSAEDDVVIFSTFEYSKDVADVTADAEKEIKITAYAVQEDGFTTAQAAWDGTFGAQP